jgi:methyltransferase (TIGR00027 family)
MEAGRPSRTALAAAAHRAAHQVLEQGRIFADSLALGILGQDAPSLARWAAEDPARQRMRMFIAVRTRFAEDALAAAIERGVQQLVVLGAGLDTYAYRGRFRERVHIFEVDHPATQTWKRQRLADAAIPIPANLTFAPVDFERQSLSDGLRAAGFDPSRQTFFTWLGVVPYLTTDAIWSTLSFIQSLPNSGQHVVFDYSDPPATFTPEQRASHDQRAARVAGLGEAWVSYFEQDELRLKLLELGFSEVEDLGPQQIVERYFPNAAAESRTKGGHVVRASKITASRNATGTS